MHCKQFLSLSVASLLLAAALTGCGAASSTASSAAGSEAASSVASSAAASETTAAALRAKDSVMTAVTAVREGADDVYAEAKAINAQRTEAETANVVEDTSAEEESQAE